MAPGLIDTQQEGSLPQLAPPMVNNNPILSELSRLSPPAVQALTQAHHNIVSTHLANAAAAQQQAQPVAAGGASKIPAQPAPEAAPQMPAGISPPSGGVPSLSGMPESSQHSIIAPRGTTAGDTSELNRLKSSGAGVDQIQNPHARIPLQIADRIGNFVAPNLLSQVPGTTAHHESLINTAQTNVATDQKGDLGRAQTAEANRRAEPEAPKLSPLSTDSGEVSFNPQTGETKPILGADGQPASAPEKAAPQSIHVLPDGKVISVQVGKDGKSQASVVYEGDPAVKTEVKQIEVGGKPHQILLNSQTGAQIKDLGETGEKPQAIHIGVDHGQAESDKLGARLAKPYEKGYESGGQTLQRIDLTRRNIDAGYVGQGLAIPELLTSLVSGQGTGVRITQAELNSITTHRGIKGNAESFFNSMAGKGALTQTDKNQIKGVLQDAETRLRLKTQIHSDALDKINGASSRDEVVAADKEARQHLNEIEQYGVYSGQKLPQGTVVGFNGGKVQIDDGKK